MDVNSKQYLSHSICRAAIRCLLMQLNQHDTLHLKSIGVDNKFASPLSCLSPREQELLVLHAHHFLSFAVDGPALEKEMQRAEENQASYELEHKFIARGAPSKMMRDLFGFHTVEYSAWRKRLNLEGEDSHRIRYCDEKTERAIWDLWEAYRHLPIRDCLLKISEKSNQKLNLINNVIDRYKNG